MNGLSSVFMNRLRLMLLQHDLFGSNEAVRLLFVDRRLHAWVYTLPEGVTAAERVDALIAYLHNKYDCHHQK